MKALAVGLAIAATEEAPRPGGSWGWHQTEIFPSASVLKAMLLVAYLDLPSLQNRTLGPPDRALLAPMIQRSDNAAAERVLDIVGAARLRALAHRAGMRHFAPVTGIWGLSRIDAADQARHFLHIDGGPAPGGSTIKSRCSLKGTSASRSRSPRTSTAATRTPRRRCSGSRCGS